MVSYPIPSSDNERDRLTSQAQVLQPYTARLLRNAGARPGACVLDLGTGMGDVALLAAAIVGPSGTVVGIDRDGVTVEKAKARAAAQGHIASVEFIHSEVLDFKSDLHFDAVIGRYILLYQPDPARAMRHVLGLIRQGGILCFHEMSR